jgi:hypothetical protein
MRRRVRRPSYVDPVLDQRARAYAIAHGLTDSAVTEAALKKYLDEGSVDEALVVRRLDCVTEVVTKILHDLNVLGVAFGGFARFSFMSAPAVTPEAIRRADSANRAFLEGAFKRLSEGVTFPQQVLKAGPKPPRGPGTHSDGDGGKGGSGT